MTTRRASLVLSLALSAQAAAVVDGSQGPPTTEVRTIICYVLGPETLDQATAKAHAIVRARMGDADVRIRPLADGSVFDVSTAYALEIVEVFKLTPQLPFPSEVLRAGGEVVTAEGTTRYVEDGFPAFDTGAEYLLFLYWNDYLETYQMAFGPDAAFRIGSDGRLEALGRGRIARQHDRLDARDVGWRISGSAAR